MIVVLKGYLDFALLPQVQANQANFGGRKASCGSTLLHSPYTHTVSDFMKVKVHASIVNEPLDIAECWANDKGEINAWIAKDKYFEADGLSGDLNNLVGMEQ
jgi:hypothetical protein